MSKGLGQKISTLKAVHKKEKGGMATKKHLSAEPLVELCKTSLLRSSFRRSPTTLGEGAAQSDLGSQGHSVLMKWGILATSGSPPTKEFCASMLGLHESVFGGGVAKRPTMQRRLITIPEALPHSVAKHCRVWPDKREAPLPTQGILLSFGELNSGCLQLRR